MKNFKNDILCGKYDNIFCALYKGVQIEKIRERYLRAYEEFLSVFGTRLEKESRIRIFSVPGRTEVLGNHTDHNRGKVLAASVDLDIIAVAATNDKKEICIKSEGYDEDAVQLCDLCEREEDFCTSRSIIRGMCDGFLKNGHKIGGFYAYTSSNVLKGSGLSSSAAFEVTVGNMLNHFYNGGKVENSEIAKIAQFAENVHFGKPCGLMDQMACAVGGFIYIDFEDTKNPILKKSRLDIAEKGYSLCIVNTGGNHADLGEDYASIPHEMKSVAKLFGKDVLRGLSLSDILSKAQQIRTSCGDRALLRAIHFLCENERVTKAFALLEAGELENFFAYLKESGESSAKFLQNMYTNKNVNEQGLTLALALSGLYLDKKQGCTYRLHGGGFAGTIQAFMKNEDVQGYKDALSFVFPEENIYILNIRPYGAIELEKEN